MFPVADSYMIGQERAAGGAATILHVSGELDINARDDLREAILTALGGGAAHDGDTTLGCDVVVDLGGVSFIDSEALSALIDGYNAARERTAGFRVVNAKGVVERVLTVSGARDLFGA